jgi:aspartate/methionine/tyrosine aminotransferase
MSEKWIAKRMRSIEVSGIRRVFDLAKSLKNPVNLSIGVPHFDVPEIAKEAAIQAIRRGENAYTVTQGIAPLREKLHAEVQERFGQPDRQTFVTSGTSGGLVLALLSTIDPGDEVIVFDPYFVMYPHFIRITGGVPVFVDTYPDFQIKIGAVEAAITPKTKAIIVNSPGNPTGAVHSRQVLKAIAQLASDRNLLLISDEVYRVFCYDQEFATPVEFNPDTLVLDGFSKSHGMTGWRLGYCHGPRHLIEEMIKLQQFTFVCAPSISQHAGAAALDADITPFVNDYRRKRDKLYDGMKDRYEIVKPGGAFYMFCKAPWGTGEEFVSAAIRQSLLSIPGGAFSRTDSHFRLSYAATEETIDRALEILQRMARR